MAGKKEPAAETKGKLDFPNLKVRVVNEPEKAAGKSQAAVPVSPATEFDPWEVLKYPHLTEKSMNMIEGMNRLIFIVDRKATKLRVKEAVEHGFNVTVTGVNIEITRNGEKKAYVTLSPENNAGEIATRLGMI